MERIIIYSIPAFMLFLGLEVYFSHHLKKNFFHFKDSIGNLGTGVLNQLMTVFTKTWLVVGYVFVLDHLNLVKKLNVDIWATDFTSIRGVLSWIIGFILVDLVYYFYHRHSHEINLLWATHIVHHSSEEYNLSVALRQSSFGFLFNFMYNMVLGLIGVPIEIFAVSYAFNLIYQFWIHTRFIRKMGWYEFLFNTPSHHRVHHARQGKYLDCNYGGVFIMFDRLFGTCIEEKDEPRYGVYPRFQSYDSVKANVYPLFEMAKYFFQARGIVEKWMVIFGGPQWTYNKFKKGQDLNIRDNKRPVDGLSLFIFVLAFALALIVLFNQALEFKYQVGLFVLVVICLKTVGLRLDSKK